MLELKLENFEGPFDLLFHLIEKNKMDIYNVEILKITEQYIDYINSVEKLNLEITSEFLVMASTLLLIKSKMLLPKKAENDIDENDLKEELIQKLVEYKKYKDVSTELFSRYEQNAGSFYKPREVIKLDSIKIENKVYAPEVIGNIYNNICKKNYQKQNKNIVAMDEILAKDKITIKSKVKEILRNFMKKSKFKFSELFASGKSSKLDVVTSFMAMLELAKLSRVMIKQEKRFGEIEISKVDR